MNKNIFEKSVKGRRSYRVKKFHYKNNILPQNMIRKSDYTLPEMSELDIMRHFIDLSSKNYHVGKGMYPLGSCTMKYNPVINEDLAILPGFIGVHPLQDENDMQGTLQLIWELGEYLKIITGMDAISLQPVAGAHGELTGMLMIRNYHIMKGKKRNKVLIPDSAHGTNPASCAMVGLKVVEIKSNEEGVIDPDIVREKMDEDTAGIMITNPNTLGIFEKNIVEVAKIVHEKGGIVYMDGANLNALMGKVKIRDLGVDLVHFNLHKTFSAPHGGGGPGGGGIACVNDMEPLLPVPRIEKNGDKFVFNSDYPYSIGRMHSFYGNFGVMIKAYSYIRMMGGEGLKQVTEDAVLNANYIRKKLEGIYNLKYKKTCMHEVVFDATKHKKEYGITALDIAKRLLDYGFHAPTIYFPLIVHEALMIEPTETESKETIDKFIEVMKKIDEESKTSPSLLKEAPTKTPVRRVNEGLAARKLDVVWRKEDV